MFPLKRYLRAWKLQWKSYIKNSAYQQIWLKPDIYNEIVSSVLEGSHWIYYFQGKIPRELFNLKIWSTAANLSKRLKGTALITHEKETEVILESRHSSHVGEGTMSWSGQPGAVGMWVGDLSAAAQFRESYTNSAQLAFRALHFTGRSPPDHQVFWAHWKSSFVSGNRGSD